MVGKTPQHPYPNWADLAAAWFVATLLSGIPSTLYALATGGDATQAIRAAGAMVLSPEASLPKLFAAAAVAHAAISFFWASVLFLTLPHRHTTLWALLGASAIAVLDLRLIAPLYFPEIAALEFWPQFADHLMWGACLGLTLEYRRRRR